MRRRPAGAILKLLRSAVVNAEANKKLSSDKLYIESVWVDGGPMLKRFLPRARGMATAIQKKSSHVTLVLIEKDSGSKRFTIVKPKKTKAVESTDSKKSDAKNKIETEGAVKAKDKPGFFRRSFQRKSV
jgi:ribosomal protein L22